jgi:hypothetical protein
MDQTSVCGQFLSAFCGRRQFDRRTFERRGIRRHRPNDVTNGATFPEVQISEFPWIAPPHFPASMQWLPAQQVRRDPNFPPPL